MKENSEIRGIMQELSKHLKKRISDDSLNIFIKLVNKQMRKIEKIRVNYIITYCCMVNNKYFDNCPKEGKCPLLKALNQKLMESNTLLCFQQDLMLIRITEYFLSKYF